MHRRFTHRHLAVIATAALLAGCSSSSDTATDASGTVAEVTTAAPTTDAAGTAAPATTEAPQEATTTTVALAPAVSTPASCPDGAPPELTCSTVAVPIDPAKPNGPTLNLAVTVRRVDPSTWDSPIVVMSGPEPFVNWATPPTHPFYEDHDLVFIDARGTGRSDGATHCPELKQYTGEIYTLHLGAKAAVAVKGCLDQARAGAIPLESLADHVAVAADLAVVRRAVGIEKWGVYARNGGVNVALQLVQADPDGITAIAGRTPQVVGSFPLSEDIEAAFDRFADDCAAIPSCAAKGDLKQLNRDALARLATPVTTRTLDPGGDPVILDANALKYATATALSTTATAKILPDIISGTASATGDDLTAASFVSAPFDSDAVDLVGICQDRDFLFPGLKADHSAETGVFAGVTTKPFCDIVGPLPQFSEPPKLTSDIPVFMAMVSYDGRSSVDTTKKIFAGFSHVEVAFVPGIADVNELADCWQSSINTFFDAPTAPLDTACLTSPAVKTLG